MTTRAVGPGRGWSWLVQAVNLGRDNAGAIFGGAALMLGLAFALAFVLALLLGGVQMAAQPGTAGGMLASMLIVLPLMALVCALMVGYLRLIDAVEHQRPARATDVFAGFRDMGTSGRVFGLVLLLTLAQYVVIGGLVAVLAPEFGSWYLEAMQASPAGGQPPQAAELPEGFGRVFPVVLVVALFLYAVQAIGVGQVALRGRGIGGALGDGVAGTLKNLLPLVVLLLVGVAAAILAGIALALLAALVGLLGKVAGTWLTLLLGIPLYMVVLLVLYVVMFGVMYFLWRDICAGDASPPVARGDQLEV